MIDSIEKLWNKLEIRVLVICSLSLQIFLLGLAGFRKHVASTRWAKTTDKTWKGPLPLMFHWLLWLAYLTADYVATVALAYLPGSERNKATLESKTHHLLMFWAPFFILHLGGQDTITALSVEDNELWARHLLTLLSQVVLAIYYYLSSNLQVGALRLPAALMFAVAIFKYGERIWSLQRASMSALRSSMTTKPDPGLNYAKLVQVYTAYRDAGLTAEINVKVEKKIGDLESQKTYQPEYKELVCKAYEFFPTFKRLFMDLILSYKNREDSQKYFEVLKADDAYKLIEIELSWMYEILHSKGSVIYSFKHYGWITRVIILVVTTTALCLFALSDHTGYGRFETRLTYVLLGGAVGLEIIALVVLLLSFWTYAEMRKINESCESSFLDHFLEFLFYIQERIRPQNNPRWSNKMAQFSLIKYSLKDQPCWWKSIMKCFGFKETWDHYRYTTYATVNKDLKNLVFQELKKKMKNIDDAASYRRFTTYRGQWALQRKGYYQEFGWSVEAEFDDSILLWHIATDLLFNDPDKPERTLDEREPQQEPQGELQPKPEPNPEPQSARKISQHISNYMSFLLIMRPFMMPAGIGQIRFGDTCAEATNFLQPLGDNEKGDFEKGDIEKGNVEKGDMEKGNVEKGDIEKGDVEKGDIEKGDVEKGDVEKGDVEKGDIEKGDTKKGNVEKGDIEKVNAVKKILDVNTDFDPELVKGDRSKSVLFKGCMLAHKLKKEFITKNPKEGWNKMWRLISVVWVEMLCYAASKCSGQFHAKQLSKGGELLTVVWFLMAHLGMGEQYQIWEGDAPYKLIVTK